MAKSIIQKHTDKFTRECFLCREEADNRGYFGELPHSGLHKHHFMHGTSNRKLAEQDGLWAYMCELRHHEHGPEAPHANAEVDLKLKRIAQEAYEKIHSHEEWMARYGKNFLE